MGEVKPEVAIDIGGGEGEFFVRLAKENPQKNFIVLDPNIERIKEAPLNLHLVRWKTDLRSNLPFLSNIIDEAYINFLFGEIGVKDDPYFENAEGQPGSYRNLLKDLKRVLKSGGTVHIADVRANIFNIHRLLKKEGFRVTLPSKQIIIDEDRTKWSKIFSGIFREWGRKKEDSCLLPMEIEARWNG